VSAKQYTFVILKPLASLWHIVPRARPTHTACGKRKPLVPPQVRLSSAATFFGVVCKSCDRMRDAETMQ